jgi:hypothetical protein
MKLVALGFILSAWLGLAACAGQGDSEPLQPGVFENNAGAGSEAQREPTGGAAVSGMVTDQVLVKFREWTDISTIERICREAGLEVLKVVSPPRLYLMKAATGSALEDAIGRLKAHPEVVYAERNYPRALKANRIHD